MAMLTHLTAATPTDPPGARPRLGIRAWVRYIWPLAIKLSSGGKGKHLPDKPTSFGALCLGAWLLLVSSSKAEAWGSRRLLPFCPPSIHWSPSLENSASQYLLNLPLIWPTATPYYRSCNHPLDSSYGLLTGLPASTLPAFSNLHQEGWRNLPHLQT